MACHVEMAHTISMIQGYNNLFSMDRMYKSLTMPHFHKLFQNMVKDWIQVATDKCKAYIVKAIAADTEITVTNDVMFSNSALDTTGFLLQVGSFWKHLKWPVASEAYGYAISVVVGISDCALFYVEEVFRKLTNKDWFDEKGHFRATEKVVSPLLSLSLSLSLFQHTHGGI